MPATLEGSITESMECRFQDLTAEEIVHWADEEFADGLVMSTSFGIQSAVTLHLVTQIRPSIPVIWVDTGYLPRETYQYAELLTDRLKLNVHVARAALSPQTMEAQYGQLWNTGRVEDLDLYDRIRKVEPMQRALATLKATGWISGLRSDQTDFRKNLPRVKYKSGHYRIYPILPWSNRQVYYYMQEHDLPQHPLFAKGYTTVGDVHSSRPLQAGDVDDRATRFQQLKQECGLHLN